MKLLSICIPTWNRSEILLENLRILLAHLQPSIIDLIEIIVSDNASSDQTMEKCLELISNTPNIEIKYSRNKENIGYDRNCQAAAKIALGKYIWFLSDDDSLTDNALLEIVSALTEHPHTVFGFINYSMLTPGFDEYFPLKFEKNLIVSADELMTRTNLAFSFISSCIFKKSAWDSLNLEKYYGTYWIQLYAAKEIALEGDNLIIGQPLIKMRREGLQESRRERRSTSHKIDLFMGFHLSFLDFLATFKDSAYKKSTYATVFEYGWNDNLNQILSMKLTSDHFNFSGLIIIFRKMRFYFSNRILFWLIHAPILFLPELFSKAIFSGKILKIKIKKFLKPYIIG